MNSKKKTSLLKNQNTLLFSLKKKLQYNSSKSFKQIVINWIEITSTTKQNFDRGFVFGTICLSVCIQDSGQTIGQFVTKIELSTHPHSPQEY